MPSATPRALFSCPVLGLLILALPAAPRALGQPVHARTLAVNPAAPDELWVVNHDNDSVSVVDLAAGAVLDVDGNPGNGTWSLPVGIRPRTITFTADGAKAYVANGRGNVPLAKTFYDFDGSEVLGSISVIDTATRTVTKTITVGVGVEPYGIVVAPNGMWAAMTNFRSASVSFVDTTTDSVLFTFAYPRNFNFPPPGMTEEDLDANGDFLVDTEYPRGIAITADSERIYVAHHKSPYVTVLDAVLDGTGQIIAANLLSKINLDVYANTDAQGNPQAVQTVASQGDPRMLEDITISPDGTKAWVAHVLHNVNHDVSFDFATTFGLPGDFANRVYPAVSVIDLTTDTFEWGSGGQTDSSTRLQFDFFAPDPPTIAVPYGYGKQGSGGFVPALSADAAPVIGTTTNIQLTRAAGGSPMAWFIGLFETDVPSFGGRLLVQPILTPSATTSGTPGAPGAGSATLPLPITNNPALTGLSMVFQAFVSDPGSGIVMSNGLKVLFGAASDAPAPNELTWKPGHPGRVEFSSDGTRAYLLSRGSEDIMIFDTSGGDPVFLGVHRRRDVANTQVPFDPSRLIGDQPLGFLLLDGADVPGLDAAVGQAGAEFLLVDNEVSRDVSVIAHDPASLAMDPVYGLIGVVQTDSFTPSERIGEELFTDASRAQTSGNFNNSCESCHFEGGEDGSVWARGVGPRSTNAMYGGAGMTGYILWKSVRLNLGETGPMFAGENGGTGIFSPAEVQGLTDYHEKVPVPLNPDYQFPLPPLVQAGEDLFLGNNNHGTNPSFRFANCATCHPKFDTVNPSTRRFFTDDKIFLADPQLPPVQQDPCLVLQENLLGKGFKNVNSCVNCDVDGDGIPDVDRNGDGISDLESYVPMNPDKAGDFTRDDVNNDPCLDAQGQPIVFTRDMQFFGIPTKMGVYATGPYFHDHAVRSLRSVCDPGGQTGNILLNKLRNNEHDMRGTFIQSFLVSTDVQADIDAVLAYIQQL